MPEPKPVFFDYEDGEMHAVRRLGGAVIAQWTALPAEVQKRLVNQAGFVQDADENVQVREQIKALIRKHNPNWDSADT